MHVIQRKTVLVVEVVVLFPLPSITIDRVYMIIVQASEVGGNQKKTHLYRSWLPVTQLQSNHNNKRCRE